MGGSTLFILIDWFHFTTKYLDMHLLNKHQTIVQHGECRENTHERNASLWKQLPTGWGVFSSAIGRTSKVNGFQLRIQIICFNLKVSLSILYGMFRFPCRPLRNHKLLYSLTVYFIAVIEALLLL